MPWGGVKKSNIIKFQLQSQFQRILIQTLSVFSQIRRDLHPVAWIMPKGRDLKVHTGGQKCNFLNMVMCHTKLKGMTRRLGFTEKFYPWIKLGRVPRFTGKTRITGKTTEIPERPKNNRELKYIH